MLEPHPRARVERVSAGPRSSPPLAARLSPSRGGMPRGLLPTERPSARARGLAGREELRWTSRGSRLEPLTKSGTGREGGEAPAPAPAGAPTRANRLTMPSCGVSSRIWPNQDEGRAENGDAAPDEGRRQAPSPTDRAKGRRRPAFTCGGAGGGYDLEPPSRPQRRAAHGSRPPGKRALVPLQPRSRARGREPRPGGRPCLHDGPLGGSARSCGTPDPSQVPAGPPPLRGRPDGNPDAIHDAATNALGGVDILVANTGGPPARTALTVRHEEWLPQFEAIVLPVFKIASLVLPGMRERRGAAS